MKYKFNGEGGEFTIGILTNKERDFIFDNVKDNGSFKISFDEFWESENLPKQWSDFDDIVHFNTPYGDGGWKIINDENEEIVLEDSLKLGSYQIDFENDDRFEMTDDNSKIIIGINHLNFWGDKGLLTEKSNDFDKDLFKDLTKESVTCLMTRSRERGDFFEFELPHDFDVKKLIVIILDIKFTEEFYVPSVDTIIYDGKIIEKDFLGETQIKERVHNIIEIDYAKDTNQFHNESILEFYTE